MSRGLFLFACIFLLLLSPSTSAWWDGAWQNRRPIQINNTNGSELNYYQVFVNLTDSPINASSLRVVNETAGSVVPHWAETVVAGDVTKLWFNCTHIPANTWLNNTYYIYYNNNAASSTSNGNTTFNFFDDFNGGSLDASKWSVLAGSAAPEDSILKPTAGDNTTIVKSNFRVFHENSVFEARAQPQNNDDFYWLGSENPDVTERIRFCFHFSDPTRRSETQDSAGSTTTDISGYFPDAGVWNVWSFEKIGTSVVNFQKNREIIATHTSNIPSSAHNVTFILSGNAPGKLWVDWVLVRDYVDTVPTTTIDEEESPGPCTTPIISNLGNTNPSASNVTITWTTNQTTRNRVKYSTNPDLSGYSWSAWQNGTTSISIDLSGLSPSTTYYYQAWSYNYTNSTCFNTSPSAQPYMNFTTAASTNVVIEITDGVGVVLNNGTSSGSVRQITPSKINITLNSTTDIDNYVLYVENTDPDLVKAYGTGITQNRYANNTIQLVFDLTANTEKTINLSRIWYPSTWSFIATGDTRPGTDGNSNHVADPFEQYIVPQVHHINPVFPVLNVGDIVGGGGAITSTPVCTEAMHQAYWSVQNNKGIWLGAVGNHDQARNGNPQGSAQEIFDKSWGAGNYSFSFGDWHFINMNSYADDGSSPDESNGGGFISDSQYDWVTNEVVSHNTTHNIVVFFHHPLWHYAGGSGGTTGDWLDTGDCNNLRNLFTASGVELTIVGHEHWHHESTEVNGLIQLVEGRGGAELHEGESLWGVSVVRVNSSGVVGITKVDLSDGNTITTTFNNSNDYTQTALKATINNGHAQSIPCVLKFRMSDSNTTSYSVSGADDYDIIQNDYGYVVIVQTNAVPSGTVEVVVSAGAGLDTDFIPPNPTNLLHTINKVWVNYTWQAGTGNVTDSYNVSLNGVWTNGTMNNYMNCNVGYNSWANITVWAFNASGSGTLSLGSVSDNVKTGEPLSVDHLSGGVDSPWDPDVNEDVVSGVEIWEKASMIVVAVSLVCMALIFFALRRWF